MIAKFRRLIRRFRSAPRRALRAAKLFARLVSASRTHFHLGFWGTLRRTLALRLEHGITLPGIYKAALTNPALTREELDNYISRPHFLRLHRRLSPPSHNLVVHNKVLFQRFCDACGLPTPGWLAFFLPCHPGLTRSGTVLTGRGAWLDFFERELSSQAFVIKEATTDYGVSIRVLQPVSGGFEDLKTRRKVSPADLYENLASAPSGSTFIFQTRIYNHETLQTLSGSDTLQTVRAVTYIDTADKFHLLWAKLRCVAEDEVQDNFNNYRGGMLELIVNPATGRIEDTHYVHEDRFGVSAMPHHPRTGRPFPGFQIPDWPALRGLSERAARTFLPTRWIGWDIAPTPDGPILIEGNPFFDTFLLYNSRALLEAEAATLKARL